MDTDSAPTGLRLADRLLLDQVSRELDDPDIPTERLVEMLADLTAIARRYEWEVCVATSDYGVN